MPKIAIPDADNTSIIGKSGEKKRHSQVINIMKEFVETNTIRKCILDLKVKFMVGKLLAFALAVEKRLTKPISEDKAVQFGVNTLSLAKIFEILIPYS